MPRHRGARDENAFGSARSRTVLPLFVFSASGGTSHVQILNELWQNPVYKLSLLKIVSEQTVIYFQNRSATSRGETNPLKSPDVYLFVMVTVPLTTSVLTGLPMITKKKKQKRKKEIMQISHRACQQFFLAEGELSTLPFELNSLHS